MIFRLLGIPGALVHLVDLVLQDRRHTPKRTATPSAGWARVAGVLFVIAGAAIVCVLALFNAAEGNANNEPTKYTVAQLVANPNVGNKVYATVTGTIYDWYVEQTKDGKFDVAYYLIGDTETDSWIIVSSRRTETETEPLVAEDGTITFTGMLRTDKGEVGETIATLGSDVPSVNISHALLLKEGQTPANSLLMYAIAGIAGLLGLLMLVGWAIGYMVFRPAKSRSGPATTGITGSLPVRVTGLVPGYSGGRRALQMKAELVVPPADPANPSPTVPVGLSRASGGEQTIMPLTPGTTEAAVGTAYAVSGERPAIRIRFLKFKLVFSFDSEVARDQAFDQLRVSAGLTATPDGAVATLR
jgi:hypothetical protein